MVTTINPATGEELETYDAHDSGEVTWMLARAWTTWQDDWRHASVDERIGVLGKAADVFESRREELAELATREMGKPIAEARAEVDKCAWLCRHYEEHAERYLAPEDVDTDARSSYVRYDPLGPILAVMPWNYPYWQVFRFAVPNIAAGNTALLSHSNNTTGVGLKCQEILQEAGLPEGAFQTLIVDHDALADVIADQRVRGVTLTGSDAAGRAVASTAGQHLKKTVLELGGSDACIVLDDADLDRAAEVAADSRLLNSGQSCIAAKRFIVMEDVYEPFLERFAAEFESRTVGDPMDEGTDIGPMARDDLRVSLHRQVQATLNQGAEVVTGGEPLDRDGFFYAPTVLRDVHPESTAASEETFGPVAAVMPAENEEVALALANSSRFGLGAAVWTEDRERGERLAGLLEAGCVFINELVKSDPRMPFGGVKDSGYGRELSWPGAREFTNVKTVWVE